MSQTILTDAQRQAVFRSVIESQDAGASVGKSRQDTAAQFGITIEQVKSIEQEGIERQWPPL